MNRFVRIAAASAALVFATAAQAESGYYVAVPVTPPAKAELMTRDTPWSLQGNAYVADRAPERDAVLCQMVARSVGKLQSFSVAGQPYSADALATCNARAR